MMGQQPMAQMMHPNMMAGGYMGGMQQRRGNMPVQQAMMPNPIPGINPMLLG